MNKMTIKPSSLDTHTSSISTRFGCNIMTLNIEIKINLIDEIRYVPFFSYITPCVVFPRRTKGRRYRTIGQVLNALGRVPEESLYIQKIIENKITTSISFGQQ